MVDGPHTPIGYNVQTAVDAKHKFMVAHAVTNDGTDQTSLAAMALQAQQALDVVALDVVADRGYYDAQNIKQCLDAGLTTSVAKPPTSRNGPQGHFTKEAFVYDTETDEYECPAGQRLPFRYESLEKGRQKRHYKHSAAACRDCKLRAQCTVNVAGRRLSRWVDEHLLEAMRERVHAQPQMIQRRRELVEHPFGTLKRGMQQGYFLCRGLTKVRGEMSLSILAYNLKRVFNILGVEPMLAALAARKPTQG
ncbi:MAG: transposase (plasmid) [Leptolyngbya sp. BL-A-14]